MENKSIKTKGEFNYDYKYDILFFKSYEREYAKSIELENFILDVDKEDFIVGMQILEASKFLQLKKSQLLKIPSWQLQATINDGRIEVRLTFQITVRNKIIEKNPIIMEPLAEYLPNSQLTCES